MLFSYEFLDLIFKQAYFFCNVLDRFFQFLGNFLHGFKCILQPFLGSFMDYYQGSYLESKRFMSIFCKRRGADGFISIPHIIKTHTTFHFIWVSMSRQSCTAAKWWDRFLIKINDLTIHFQVNFSMLQKKFLQTPYRTYSERIHNTYLTDIRFNFPGSWAYLSIFENKLCLDGSRLILWS